VKKIIAEIREHIQKDFDKSAYGYIFIIAIILISVNYFTNFERSVIHPFIGESRGPIIFTFYYAIPYYIGLIPFLLIKKQSFKLSSVRLWIKSFLFILIIGSFSALTVHVKIAELFSKNILENIYLRLLVGNLKKVIPYLISLYIIYLIFDRKSHNFYGLNSSNLDYKPFFIMLLMVLPLVISASFLPDFQAYYPRFKYWENISVFGLNKLAMNAIFLICYAMDFISVELMFRGALIIGMVTILGREAILPTALLYMVFHFGKPLGETISSFFGGYILGVLSYYHKNIKGGIIVHIGLAWMMEAAAILQHIRTN